MYWIIEAQFLLALSLTGVSEVSDNHGASPIKLVETGVAKTYSASKDIACGEYSWRVKWASAKDPATITGEVIVMINGKGVLINDSAKDIFNRFSNVNTVSATCNTASERSPTLSHLLILGTDASTGTEALAKLTVEENLAYSWSYDVD